MDKNDIIAFIKQIDLSELYTKDILKPFVEGESYPNIDFQIYLRDLMSVEMDKTYSTMLKALIKALPTESRASIPDDFVGITNRGFLQYAIWSAHLKAKDVLDVRHIQKIDKWIGEYDSEEFLWNGDKERHIAGYWDVLKLTKRYMPPYEKDNVHYQLFSNIKSVCGVSSNKNEYEGKVTWRLQRWMTKDEFIIYLRLKTALEARRKYIEYLWNSLIDATLKSEDLAKFEQFFMDIIFLIDHHFEGHNAILNIDLKDNFLELSKGVVKPFNRVFKATGVSIKPYIDFVADNSLYDAMYLAEMEMEGLSDQNEFTYLDLMNGKTAAPPKAEGSADPFEEFDMLEEDWE